MTTKKAVFACPPNDYGAVLYHTCTGNKIPDSELKHLHDVLAPIHKKIVQESREDAARENLTKVTKGRRN